MNKNSDYYSQQAIIWDSVYEENDKLPWTENPVPHNVLEQFYKKINGKVLLDYGCGDGLLTEFFVHKNMDVTCSDISKKILAKVRARFSSVKTIQASNPSEINNQYDAIIVWGVMHHVDINEWDFFIKGFKNLLRKNGIILIGGHSRKDSEFSKGYRISPTTKEKSWALDNFEEKAKNAGMNLVDKGYFPFREAFTSYKRIFKYFIFEN